MSNLAVLAALPASALALVVLLRSPLARRLGRKPSENRWTTSATPLVGGPAIYLGFSGALWLAIAIGPLTASQQIVGIFGAASLLFVAGLVDDLWSLPPLAKLAAQLGGAAIVLSTGTSVEVVSAHWLAIVLGLVWLVGLTNAFNLLDNMDGLAGTLAAVSAGFFAIAGEWLLGSRLVLVLALSLVLALAGFLPFNLRPGRRALAWMGDSGSQLIGFLLASLGLVTSYTVASSTVLTLLLPVVVLAVPILDTTLVTIVRLMDGRSIAAGGRDHSSHRLVALGMSETGTVVLLALVSAALGGTSLAYQAFGNGRIAAVGVLVTFALLVQFGTMLAAVDRSPGDEPVSTLRLHVRRTAEVVVDGGLVGASFLAAYLLRFNGLGSPLQRNFFLAALPVLLFCRYIALLLAGMYGGVWRYASSRDAARAITAVVFSEIAAAGVMGITRGGFGHFSRNVFVIDAFICSAAIVASRFAERAFSGGIQLARPERLHRVLIVGAGRTGRSLLRELRETPGERVVGFVDDDPFLRGRRVSGARVLGSSASLAAQLERARPDVVMVTIPDAPRERLDGIVRACSEHGIACRFVRREIDLDPRVALQAEVP